MADSSPVEQLRHLVRESTITPINDLVINTNWGAINFEGARTDLKRIFKILVSLKELPIEGLPNGVAQEIVDAVIPVQRIIGQIRDFNLSIENPAGHRDHLITELGKHTVQLYQHATPWILYLAYETGDIQTKITEVNDAVVSVQNFVESAKERAKDQIEEIGRIGTAAREAAAATGVVQFTDDFRSEATSFEESARKWLLASVSTAGLTAVVAVLTIFMFPLPPFADAAAIVQYSTSKLVLLGLLFAAAAWCGQMYRATKHQASLNKHRANSLKTFQAFVRAASDDQTRDAVLLETTRSIFAPGASGYIKETDTSGDGGIRVIELVKSSAREPGAQGE